MNEIELFFASLLLYVIDWLKSPAGTALYEKLLSKIETQIENAEGMPPAPASTAPASTAPASTVLPRSVSGKRSSVPTD